MNKVAESGIITLNLEEFLPEEDIVVFDIKPYLFMELILKEKEFRQSLQQVDWQQLYTNKYVSIICSADAIVPVWAYMLVASYLQQVAKDCFFGAKEQYLDFLIRQNLSRIDVNSFVDKRVVVKGCGEKFIPSSAYVHITFILKPVAKSIMYGEPCSTVPIYKNKQA